MKIDNFRNEFYFLSNFFEAPVFYNGLSFQSNEAAFQAQKCPDRAEEFVNLDPSTAKRLGRRVQLRPDWESVKDAVMYEICLAKFIQNPKLKARLLLTGDAELVEGNTWGDKYWGICDGEGKNQLGKTLMRVRSELHD